MLYYVRCWLRQLRLPLQIHLDRQHWHREVLHPPQIHRAQIHAAIQPHYRVEFGTKLINIGGKNIRLQIWDTAGQERYRAVTKNYYRGAVGGLLVYDITSRDTYNELQRWLTDARSLANRNCCIVVVGNKCDLKEAREVTHVEACRFAQENDLIFLESSALTGEGVDEGFMQCARKILTGIESGSVHIEGHSSSTVTSSGAVSSGTARTGWGCRC